MLMLPAIAKSGVPQTNIIHRCDALALLPAYTPMPKFSVIYIDCPWDFNVWSKETAQRYVSRHYEPMTSERIKGLPIADLAADNCAVLSWATYPNLPQAIEAGQAWGFKYSTVAFTWAKTRPKAHNTLFTTDIADATNWHFGMGYFTRSNAEICLLFTKGSPKRLNADVRQLIVAPVGKHSAKPHEAYSRIERLFSGPYLEAFARNRRAGWTSVGDEIDGLDICQSLAQLKQNRLATSALYGSDV